MSLTNPNTPVSQQDLKDLYEQKILPYIGGAFGLVATGIDSANLYSTTERVIGQWIDGKPIYQKTITGTTGSSSNPDIYTSIGASIDKVVYIKAMLLDSEYNQWTSLPREYYSSGGLLQNFAIVKNSQDNSHPNSLRVYVQSHYESEFIATIQYTKTTDSAVESYGTDTTYSTDEHVVGSWIDGRPVYQKTITGTAPSSSSTQNVQIGANVENALVIGGYCQHDSFLTPINAQVDTNEYLMVWVRNNSHPTVPNTLGIKAGSALYGGSYNITLQYTKPSST